MKFAIYSLITRSSVSILSYSISAYSIIILIFSIVIFLSNSHCQSILSRQTNQMGEICSCGFQVPQQKFCEHDFVLAGKRVNRNVRTFNTNNGLQIPELAPYMGQIYRIRLRFNFKGVFIDYSRRKLTVNIYVLRGPICGVSDYTNLERKKNFVLSGYIYKSLMIISSCNWIQPLKTLTSIQAIGLFENLYQNYCDLSNKCQITVDCQSQNCLEQFCRINLKYKDCYGKYAICHLQKNNKCGISTSLIDLSKKYNITKIPKSLRKSFNKDKHQFEILKSTQFKFCVISKIFTP